MNEMGIVGRRYNTRLGRRVLVARDAAAVEKHLVLVDAAVAALKGGGDVWLRPEVAACLERWRDELATTARYRAERLGVPAHAGIIIATSAYRALGTPCALGTPFADEGGALDSHDDYGHWSGWAVDVPTRWTRESFFPVVSVEECWLAAERAGLVRPFRAEYWHWRPADALLRERDEEALAACAT
jgi:hypothetical protein